MIAEYTTGWWDIDAALSGTGWKIHYATGGTVGRKSLLHLVERIEVREKKIVIVPRPEFAAPDDYPNKNAPLVEARFSPTPVV